jgi:hypothetical protein
LKVLVEVDVNRTKKYTSVKPNFIVNQDVPVSFDEHLFFSFSDLLPDQCQQLSISIRVYNKGLVKNEVIGTFQCDLQSVYYAPDHALEH